MDCAVAWNFSRNIKANFKVSPHFTLVECCAVPLLPHAPFGAVVSGRLKVEARIKELARSVLSHDRRELALYADGIELHFSVADEKSLPWGVDESNGDSVYAEAIFDMPKVELFKARRPDTISVAKTPLWILEIGDVFFGNKDWGDVRFRGLDPTRSRWFYLPAHWNASAQRSLSSHVN